MSAVLEFVAVDAVWSALLAPFVWLVARLTRRPRLAHALWLIVLLRLATPPLMSIELPLLNGGQVAPSSARPTDSHEQPIFGSEAVVPGASLERSPVRRIGPLGVGLLTTVFVVWLVGALTWTAYTAICVRRFHRLVTQADSAPADFQARAERCAELVGLRKCPSVRLAEGRFPPLVWAVGQPIVLLPKELLARLAADQVDAVLVHELAHVVRRDHWTRKLEFLVCALHWWNPISRFVREQLREAEEGCCDAIVALKCPTSPKRYGHALLEGLAFLNDGVHVPLVASGLSGTNSIKRRLAMILDGNVNQRLGWLGRVSVTALALCLLVGSVALTAAPPDEPSLSGDGDQAKADPTEDPDAAHYRSLAGAIVSGSAIRDPRRLAERTDLVSVMLEGPKITDADLGRVGQSPQLVELGLIDTGVKGSGLQHLKGLDKLETLVLVGPTVTDAWLENLPELERLKTLRLWGVDITNRGLQSLARFPNLEGLYIQGVGIGGGGLDVLRQLPKLKRLDLKYTKVDDRDLQVLADLPQLEHLSLGSPKVKGPGLANLLAAKNLRELQFVGKGATDAWMQEVEPLRNVEWIELHTTGVTSNGLAAIEHWSKLKHAYLNQNPIDDRSVPHLAGLYRLDIIELNGTNLTPAGIARLHDALPDTGVGFRAADENVDPYATPKGR